MVRNLKAATHAIYEHSRACAFPGSIALSGGLDGGHEDLKWRSAVHKFGCIFTPIFPSLFQVLLLGGV